MFLRSLLIGFIALFPLMGFAQTEYCTAPGELVSDDPVGDVVPAPGSGLDVLTVHVAEPAEDDGKLHFTLKIDRNTLGATPQTRHYINFITPDGVERFVRYTPYPIPGAENAFSGADQMFSVGHIEDGSSVTDVPGEAESNAATDGSITIVAKARTLNLRPGDVITDIEGETAIYTVAGRVPVDTSDTLGSYAVRGNESCKGKSAEARAVEDKSGTNFGGAFAPWMLMLLVALRRRMALVVSVAVLLTPAVGAAQSADPACSAPGEEVSVDESGDSTLVGAVPDPVPGHDVIAVAIAEPFAEGKEQLVITQTLAASALPVPTPNTVYYVTFTLSDGLTHFVTYNPTTLPEPIASQPQVDDAPFEYGHVETLATGNGSNVKDGNLDVESAVSGNVITYVLSKNKMEALASTPMIIDIVGEARAVIGAFGRGLVSPVDDTSPGVYRQRGNVNCKAKSAQKVGAVEDKSATNFGGAFAPFMLLALALLRRRV